MRSLRITDEFRERDRFRAIQFQRSGHTWPSVRGPAKSFTSQMSSRQKSPKYAESGAAVNSAYRTMLAVPLLRKERHRCSHHLARRGPALFGKADRAAQNLRRPGGDRHREVRLFKELQRAQPRSAARRWSIRRRRARCCIISRSPTDVQPVLERHRRERRASLLVPMTWSHIVIHEGECMPVGGSL